MSDTDKKLRLPGRRGTRYGDKLFWLDVAPVYVTDNDAVVILTLREHYANGKVLGREIACHEHVSRLRQIANDIETCLNGASLASKVETL